MMRKSMCQRKKAMQGGFAQENQEVADLESPRWVLYEGNWRDMSSTRERFKNKFCKTEQLIYPCAVYVSLQCNALSVAAKKKKSNDDAMMQ